MVKRLVRLWWLARYRVLDKHYDQLRMAAFVLATLVAVISALLLVLGAYAQLQAGVPPAQG